MMPSKISLLFLLGILASHPLLASQGVGPSERVLRFADPNEACALVAGPGDFILQKVAVPEVLEQENGTETASKRTSSEMFGRGTMALIRLKEILSLNDPFLMKYGHAELITQISSGKNIASWSFYPPSFQRRQEREAQEKGEAFERQPNFRRYSYSSIEYRSNFSIYRMKALTSSGSVRQREKALERGQFTEAGDFEDQTSRLDRAYGSRGVCSDFVNWAHGNHATSWWNFIPVVRKGLASVFPPEAFTTPDDLAESPYTRKVCEVGQRVVKDEDGALSLTEPELIYPGFVCTKDLIATLDPALKSSNPRVASHARHVEAFLTNEGIIDSDHRVLVKKLHFLEPISEAERATEQARCQVCRQEQQSRAAAFGGKTGQVLPPMNEACRTSCAKARVVSCD
jgi:hypothetical protein